MREWVQRRSTSAKSGRRRDDARTGRADVSDRMAHSGRHRTSARGVVRPRCRVDGNVSRRAQAVRSSTRPNVRRKTCDHDASRLHVAIQVSLLRVRRLVSTAVPRVLFVCKRRAIVSVDGVSRGPAHFVGWVAPQGARHAQRAAARSGRCAVAIGRVSILATRGLRCHREGTSGTSHRPRSAQKRISKG